VLGVVYPFGEAVREAESREDEDAVEGEGVGWVVKESGGVEM
jgi:hypothetical protein